MTSVQLEAIGAWCARRPLAVPVLHRRGVEAADPARSLAACCGAARVELEVVIAEVAARETEVAAPWRGHALALLIDHIVRAYHRPFAGEVAEADAAIAAAASGRASAAWQPLRDRLAELSGDMLQHMAKEERVLFPWLRTRPDTAAAPIRAMQLEHSDTIGLIHMLYADAARCLAGARVAEVVRLLDRLIDRLCAHIHLESNELFPRALDAARSPGG